MCFWDPSDVVKQVFEKTGNLSENHARRIHPGNSFSKKSTFHNFQVICFDIIPSNCFIKSTNVAHCCFVPSSQICRYTSGKSIVKLYIKKRMVKNCLRWENFLLLFEICFVLFRVISKYIGKSKFSEWPWPIAALIMIIWRKTSFICWVTWGHVPRCCVRPGCRAVWGWRS